MNILEIPLIKYKTLCENISDYEKKYYSIIDKKSMPDILSISLDCSMAKSSLLIKEVNAVITLLHDVVKIGLINKTIKYGENLNKHNGVSILVSVNKKDTMKFATLIKIIDNFNFIPLKIYKNYNKLFTELQNDQQMNKLNNKTKMKLDLTIHQLDDIPKTMIEYCKKIINNISDGSIIYITNVLKIINTFGINQFSLAYIIDNYLKILSGSIQSGKYELDTTFNNIEYISYVHYQMKTKRIEQLGSKQLGSKQFIEDEKKIHNYKFIFDQKFQEIFRCINLLLTIDPDVKMFNATLTTSEFDQHHNLINALYKNKLFTSIMLKYRVNETELKPIIDNFANCYHQITTNWTNYYPYLLINLNISINSFTFEQIIMSSNLNIIISYVKKYECSTFKVNDLINILAMLNMIDEEQVLQIFEFIMLKLKLHQDNMNEIFQLMDYLGVYRMKGYGRIVRNTIVGYYNNLIKFRSDVEKVNMHEFITTLWSVFPADQNITVFSYADIDLKNPEIPTKSELTKIIKEEIQIDRLGNKFMGVKINLDKIRNYDFDCAGLLLPYLDKNGYCIESVGSFVKGMSRYICL